MRIGFFGDGPWASNSIERLGETPFEVVFVVPRYTTDDGSLEACANRLQLPLHLEKNVNCPQFHRRLEEYGTDLFVSMSFDQILKSDMLSIPRLGFINCHAGALPFYRGRNPLNWVLINGESSFGITVHYIDGGIDTGDILLQEHYPIGPDEDYGQILEVAHRECPRLLVDAISAIANGTAARTPQSTIHPVGFYCCRRRDGDERIDWNWSSQRIHNFIRGIAPPAPGARTLIEGQEPLAILKSRKVTGAPDYLGTPGEVVGRNERGVVVKTGDSTIFIAQVSSVTSNGDLDKIDIPGYPIGTRFVG